MLATSARRAVGQERGRGAWRMIATDRHRSRLARGGPAGRSGRRAGADFLYSHVEIQLDREPAIADDGERIGRRRQLEIGLGGAVTVATLGGDPGGTGEVLVASRPQKRSNNQSDNAQLGFSLSCSKRIL